jgi:hypothetical protein
MPTAPTPIATNDRDREMRTLSAVLVAVGLAMGGCARHVPEPPNVAPGTPHISWVIMSGDRENPDQDFVCQSDPPNDCLIGVSRPDAQIFSDVHFYYHGVGADTKYTGSIEVGFLQGAAVLRPNITVKKNEDIGYQSVNGIVTTQPGTYAVRFELVALVTDSGKAHQIGDQVRIVVK